MKIKNKNKLKLLGVLGISLCFGACALLNNVQPKAVKADSESVSETESVSYPIYDDSSYSITLSAYQLNNYTFENFYNFLASEEINETSSNFNYYAGIYELVYNTQIYQFDDIDGGDLVFIDSNEDYLYINYTDYRISIDSVEGDFTHNLGISYDQDDLGDWDTTTYYSVYYNELKTAIQADIEANAPAPMGDTIIGAITSGLGLIGDLARQFLNGFTALFWNNNQLTPFATFALVMLGVAITMAVVSLVLNVIRGNTGA